jgi:hypothetical protein
MENLTTPQVAIKLELILIFVVACAAFNQELY